MFLIVFRLLGDFPFGVRKARAYALVALLFTD